MAKQLTFWHFLLALTAFWAVSLADFFLKVNLSQLNLMVAGGFFILYNPTGLFGNKRLEFGLCTLLILVATFFIPAKTWGPWLFCLMVGLSIFFSKESLSFLVIGRLIIWTAAFFNLAFITNTRINDVQYDFSSCYNYIEYILENNFMFWHENPLLTRPSYSAYHPILHFFTAAGVIRLGELLNVSKEFASEAVQVLFVGYMMWYGLLCAKILSLFKLNRFSFGALLAFVVCFPVYHAIAGFFNNDCLLLPLQAGVIYYSLLYYYNGGKKNLIYVWLFATFAAATKLSGILVLPFVGAVLVLRLARYQNKETFIEEFVFGLLLLLGVMIWPLYQYFVLHIDFSYVPPQAHLSLQGHNLWERYSPFGAFVYERMFYNDYGVNLWETMTKTALFGQWDFTVRGGAIMPVITSMVFIYKVILGLIFIAFLWLLFKAKSKSMCGLSVVLLFSLLGGMILFGLRHPYMCNQDFRYVAVLPLIWMMILAQFTEVSYLRLQRIVAFVLTLFAVLSCFVWQYVSV